MANEITVIAGMNWSKTYLKGQIPTQATQITMTGTHRCASVQDIGFAAHELLVIPAELATLGYAYLRNLDSTNYVEIGRDVAATFYPVLKLKPGEVALVRFSNVALYAKANTAAVKLQYDVLED
jgi:hypothetical protein